MLWERWEVTRLEESTGSTYVRRCIPGGAMWTFSSRQWDSLEMNKEGKDVIGSVFQKINIWGIGNG